MKISHNWLSRYLSDIPGPSETAKRLTLGGLEVDDTEQIGSDFEGIVVGEVLKVEPHPDADRLVVCNVDTGSDEPSQIVCGAPNVAPGQKVPVATVGSLLPKPLPDGSPFKIRKAKIRGQQSAGMICAEDELLLSDDHSGIMVLDPALKPGTPFAEIIEPNKDTVFEIELTPNRPDAACHVGVARDLAATTGARLRKPLDDLPDFVKSLGKDTIHITDTDKCHRYTGILIKGVSVEESPQWLKKLLQAIGLRPVNNVVDITNFVLHELGQPLHAFDYQRLAKGRIDVRSFDSEVSFTTLDEVEHDVPAGSLFICDGEKPVALAGIMGGVNSEISEDTTDILIESAWFEPTGIRKTARRLALQTDSSYRFERGVDPNITRAAALRCVGLLQELCGGTIEGMEDVHPVKTYPREIALRHDRLTRILGVPLAKDRVAGILEHLEIPTVELQHKNANEQQQEHSNRRTGLSSDKASSNSEAVWNCKVPTFRPDIISEIDLIEEVARIYDYNNIPAPRYITIADPEPVPYREEFREKVRRAAVVAGLKEIYSNSLLPERLLEPLGGEDVVVPTLNPITKDQALLRPTLLYGFLRSAAYNFNRDAHGVRFFEIGNIFRKDKDGGTWIEGIHESTHLHIGIAGRTHSDHWKTPAREFDLFDLKSLLTAILKQLGLEDLVDWKVSGEHIELVVSQTALANTAASQAKENGKHSNKEGKNQKSFDSLVIGTLSTVSDEWKKRTDLETGVFSAEMDIGILQELSEDTRNRTYRPVSRFPAYEFDLALVVDKNVQAGDLEKSMHHIAGETLKSTEVFDVFEGGSLEKSQKSIAFRLTFQDNDKTLTNEEVDPVIQRILKELESQYSAKLRS